MAPPRLGRASELTPRLAARLEMGAMKAANGDSDGGSMRLRVRMLATCQHKQRECNKVKAGTAATRGADATGTEARQRR